MSKVLPLIALATLTFLLTACESTQSTPGKKVADTPAFDISKGSSTADLLAVLGEPLKIEPYKENPEHLQIWFYEIEKSKTDMTVLRTEEVPYFDPFTGTEKTMEESVLVPETTTSKMIIQVFILDDHVIGWKVDRNQKSNISD